MINIHLEKNKTALGEAAAQLGAEVIRSAIADRGYANIVLATGISQFEFLAALVRHGEIDWSRITAFHLDEYVAMPDDHPASFRRYLRERLFSHLPPLREVHLINGEGPDLGAELARLNALIAERPIDVAFAGIGENGHLAFNDPPADFEAKEAFRVVRLDERCRKQQLAEGWFPTLDDVPLEAISMTIPQIVGSRVVILSVPGRRKADAVYGALKGPVTSMCPASILQRHSNCHVFLDPESACRL